MDLHCQMIMDEFYEKRASFETMKDIVLTKLQNMIHEIGMLIVAVEGRVKDPKSLEGKLELKGYKYADLTEITDILGARVITFYTSEVDKIASMVEQTFDIDWENSVDKRKALATDQFGYMSLHYICRIPKELYYDPEHPEINELRFELQMRTALQHVWATVYHDTGYKSDIEVPKVYIRSLSRLAGLLEIADEQFNGIIGELADYRRKIRALIKDGNFDDLAIDGDSFRSYLEINPFGPLNERIAEINKAEIQETDFMIYLPVFEMMELKTLGDLQRLIADYSEEAYQLALIQIGGTDLDIVAATIGLRNLCIVAILKNGGGESDLLRFYNVINGERASNRASAKRILELVEKLDLK